MTVPTLEHAAALQSVDALLAYHDEMFVQLAFLSMLGRAADTDGMMHYLSRVRSGVDKAQILAEIKLSPEGDAYPTSMAGLDAVLRSYGWLKSPVLGRFVRMYQRLDNGDMILRKVRALDNQLARHQHGLAYELCRVDEQAQHTTDNLNKLENRVERTIGILQQELQQQNVEQQSALARLEEQFVNRLESVAQQLAVQQTTTASLEDQLAGRLESVAQQLAVQQTTTASLEDQLAGRLESMAQQLAAQQTTTASLEGQLSQRVDDLTQQLSQLRVITESMQYEQELAEAAQVVTETKEYRVAIRPLAGVLPELATVPRVSIVVVQYQKSEVTRCCIRSLLRYTDMRDVEIVVVDNGSAPEHVAALEREFASSINIVRLGVNRYFGEGNNIGVEAARGEYIVLMNNDVVVTAGWLAGLLPHLQAGTGVVAPTFLYPDGRVQECGAQVDGQGYPVQNLKFGNQSELPRAQLECDYVSAALMLLRKRDYLAVGGFSPEYEPAYYEDVDFCLKLAAHQLRTMCVPQVRVYHVENATSASFSFGVSVTTLLAITRNVLMSRWHAYLQHRIPDNLTSAFDMAPVIPADTGMRDDLPTALFYLPAIGLDATTRHAMTIAQAMATSHQLSFSGPDAYSRSRLLQLAQHWGLSLAHAQYIVWDAIPASQHWDKFFVFGNTLFPPMASPADHSIYVCEFPEDAANPAWSNQVLVAGYQYWCQSEWIKHRLCDQGVVEAERVRVLPAPVRRFTAAAHKEAIILSVGEFVTHNQQHLLIEAFARLAASGHFDGWRLVLAGSLDPQAQELSYLSQCMERANGLAVDFIFDDAVDKLQEVYARAAVYWHGTGMGVMTDSLPEQLDRAGVAALEAAGAGCSVFIPNSGSVFEWMFAAPGGVYSCASVEQLVNLMVEIKSATGFDPGITAERLDAWLQERDLGRFAEQVLRAE